MMNIDDYELDTLFRVKQKKLKHKRLKIREQMLAEDGFRCLHCGSFVISHPLLSGVQHRNHCPYCLWSRHLDLLEAGDRLAACKSPMEPLGLSLKRVHKKYASESNGELMLVHRCQECGKVSTNRIAADDDVDRMLATFNSSLTMSRSNRARLVYEGISILDDAQEELVRLRLLGN